MNPFANSFEHLLSELHWLDLLIRLQVHRARALQCGDERFAGLYVSEEEAETLSAESTGLPRWAVAHGSDSNAQRVLDELSRTVAERVKATIEAGVCLRLERLGSLFALEPFDRKVLLICMAPEIDRRYERLFAYLQDDVTKRRPSVDLVLNLLSDSITAKLCALERFATGSPLIGNRLVELVEDPAYPKSPLISRYLKLDERIVRYLLGSDELDVQLRTILWRVPQRQTNGALISSATLQSALDRAAAWCEDNGQLLVHLCGPRGIGKKSWAELLSLRLGLGLIVLDGEAIVSCAKEGFETSVHLAFREAALQGSAIYWEGFDAILTNESRPLLQALHRVLAEGHGLLFVAGSAKWERESLDGRAGFLRLEFPQPNRTERVQLWQRALEGELLPEVSTELPLIASNFRLTAGAIQAAAATAREQARWRKPEDPRPTVDELYASCRSQSSCKLGELAKKVATCYGWHDLVLPVDALQQLHEICNSIRHQACVFETWGFEKKLSLGKGLSALFSGPSGTGKTMAAGIMARELGLDLYKIDLSGVVSKYIGETEKNLARVFAEAETTSAILFFDEADALFGKRSEVKDAHDRYANVETSYLLQRMEEYEGITILATNLRRNMDEAFLRRLAFVLQFPMPEEAERLRIWNRVFPDAMPRHPDLNLAFMARQFKLSGGNIKNIALAAAFLAASDGRAVSMVHLVRAARRELSKMGKSCVMGEFGEYAAMLEG